MLRYEHRHRVGPARVARGWNRRLIEWDTEYPGRRRVPAWGAFSAGSGIATNTALVAGTLVAL